MVRLVNDVSPSARASPFRIWRSAGHPNLRDDDTCPNLLGRAGRAPAQVDDQAAEEVARRPAAEGAVREKRSERIVKSSSWCVQHDREAL